MIECGCERELLPGKLAHFLEDDCGKDALRLAAQGNTILVELLRLSENIPTPFLDPDRCDEKELIYTFSYFREAEAIEAKIQGSPELVQKDDTFRDAYLEALGRFYTFFRSVYRYVTELNRFVNGIENGAYVPHSVDSVLSTLDGTQLLCEVFHLYGTMLILMDCKIVGKVRESLIVSYIRYHGAGEPQLLDVARLCRATGYQPGEPAPWGYPVAFLDRVPVSKNVIAQLIMRIRSGDVYQMLPQYYPPAHRSVALSLQGSLIFTLLFFQPETLESDEAAMREIIDKHFPDVWVVSHYIGFMVNLVAYWRDFPAASSAIRHTINVSNASYHETRIQGLLRRTTEQLKNELSEGILSEEYILEHIYSSLLPLVRDSNAALHWYVLHDAQSNTCGPYSAECDEIYAVVYRTVSGDDIVTLLLLTARLEFKLRKVLEQFLREKPQKWDEAKRSSLNEMRKLSRLFSGKEVLSGMERDPQLGKWFREVADRIDRVKDTDGAAASRRLQRIVKTLVDVQEFRQVHSNPHVGQCVKDTCARLHHMIRALGMGDEILLTIDTLGGLSYVWWNISLSPRFVEKIYERVQSIPELSTQMQAVFAKLSTILKLPCKRIEQACRNDKRLVIALEETSEYYALHLVEFARRIMHAIPTSIFRTLRSVMDLFMSCYHECPPKLYRGEMKVVSQLDLRGRLSAYAAKVVRYASGILRMENMVIGEIEVDSRQLLEDGIRRELVKLIAQELHEGISCHPSKLAFAASLDEDLAKLGPRLRSIRDSLEYVQDYINIHGLRLWVEEFSRVVYFTAEMECGLFAKKYTSGSSAYQSESIPIPYFGCGKEEGDSGRSSYSFLVHIVQKLLYLTDPDESTYLPACGAWFSRLSKAEVVGLCTFRKIATTLGPAFLVALDCVLCAFIAGDLQFLDLKIRLTSEEGHDTLSKVMQRLSPASLTPTTAREDYETILSVASATLSEVTEALVRVGRLNFMRRLLASALRCAAKEVSGCWYAALSTFNEAVVADAYRSPKGHTLEEQSEANCINQAYASEDTIMGLSFLLNRVGIIDVENQIFVPPKPTPNMPLYLLSLTLHGASHIVWSEGVSSWTPDATQGIQDCVDPTPFVAGLALLVGQLPPDMIGAFLAHVSQAIRVNALACGSADATSQELENLHIFSEALKFILQTLAQAIGWPLSDLEMVTPPTMSEMLGHAFIRPTQVEWF